MNTILIVDDEEDARLYLEITLTSQGYEIISATNGREALELARQDRPDLVISDVLMPVMDGFEFCRQMKEDSEFNRIPFIFLTGTYTDERDQKLAMAVGAASYLLKPIEPEPLLKIVRQVMAKSQETLSAQASDEKAGINVIEQHRDVVSRKLEKKVAELKNKQTS